MRAYSNHSSRRPAVAIIAFLFLLSAARNGSGQDLATDALTAGTASDATPQADKLPSVFDGVGIDEQLGSSASLTTRFKDEQGNDVTLASYLGKGRPVLLNFAYLKCPMLCSIMLESLAGTFHDMKLEAGTDFDVVTVSFSPTETPELASSEKVRYIERVGRDGAAEGWHFLTGDAANIKLLTESAGFHFKWIEKTQDYAHPAALMFMSEEGVFTRYLHGMSFPVKDVRQAVVEASEGKVGTAFDKIILYCYRYDATANSYVIHAQNLMKIAGLLTLVLLLLGLTIFWRRERQRHLPANQSGSQAAPHPGSFKRMAVASDRPDTAHIELINQNRANG